MLDPAVNYDELTMASALAHQVLPAAAIMITVCAAWFMACRWYYRVEEQEQREALRLPADYEVGALDPMMAILATHRRIAGQGSPADRLFFGGLGAAALICLGALAAYWPV